MATRRTVLAIWCIILGGALGLTVVAAIFGPGIWSRVGDAGEVLAWVVFGMAVACLPVSRVLPNRIKPTPGATAESIAVARGIVATAMNGGAALGAPLAWMVSGKMIALGALAISLVGMLLALPSERRWQEQCRSIAVRFGQELAAGANASRARRPLPRMAVALFGVTLLAAGAVLVLQANIFWTEEVPHKPASPAAHALLASMLAMMMTGFAVARFVRASASRHPWWQRAHGALLLVFAGFLIVHALRMV